MLDRINYWYERVNLNRELMKQLQIPQITMTLNEYEVKDLLYILGAFRQVVEQKGMIIIDDDGIMHKVLPIDTLDKISIQEMSDAVV